VSDDWQGKRAKDLPFSRDTVVNDCPGFLGEGIPESLALSCSRLVTSVYLRFNTAADNVNSPGRADQSAHRGILGNHGLDCPQSLVGFDRGEDGFPHVPVDPSGMSGGADEVVIKHVVYTRRVIGAVCCQDKE